MTQSLHAIMWYLFIIWLPNLMRAMHVYLTSLNGVCVCVCVCVVCVKHIVRSIIHGLDSEHLARAFMYYDLNST